MLDMGGLRWIAENWVTTLNAVGVIGGLLFTASASRSEERTRRVANLLTITRNHREIWSDFYRTRELARVLAPAPDLVHQPITRQEEIFVNLVILHLSSVFHALKDDVLIHQEGLRRDVAGFFSLPIPTVVWERSRALQNAAFVSYVEACRNWK